MAQVTSFKEFQDAINALEPLIQIVTGFSIASQISIAHTVTIESLTPDTPATLSKDNTYFPSLFRISNGGALTLNNVIVDGNPAGHPVDNENNRSLILVTGGSLSLRGSTIIKGGRSYLEGGGIYLNSSSTDANTLSIGGNVQIIDCVSRTNGGGIMIASRNPQDTVDITDNVNISMNRAVNGGGIYMRSYVPESGCHLAITDSVHVTGNQADSTGGGICFSGYRTGSASPSVLSLEGNAAISGNQAVNGAGIYFYSANLQDNMRLLGNASITQNVASQNGGGCYYTAAGVPVDLEVSSASVSNNMAGTGGAFYLLNDSGGSVRISKTSITGNKACNGLSGSGGGIWIQNQSVDAHLNVLLNNTTLAHNQASAAGGGLRLYSQGGCSCLLEDCIISENTAGQNGGGLIISNALKASVQFRRTSVLRNTAYVSGGGFYFANTVNNATADIALTETVIAENTAAQEGGGVRLTSGNGILTTILTDCTVISNTAQDNSGGGIWNGGAENALTIEGSTSVTGNNTRSGNGGGIYYNSSNGFVRLTGNVKITDNHADAVSTEFGNHGGGICLVPGKMTIQDSVEIAFNSAGKYGGGISAAENSEVSIQGGSIHDNRSDLYGGAILNHGGSTTSITGGMLTGNQAPYGGGVYNDAFLNIAGSRDLSDGVYIENRTAAVQLTGRMTDAAVVQLETSRYVSPNAAGTPIVVGEATASYPVLSPSDSAIFLKPLLGFEDWEIRLNEDMTQILLAPIIGQTITFCGNDSCEANAQDVPAPLMVAYGANAILPAVIPTRNGYVFREWNTYQCCEGQTFNPGDTIPSVTTDVTLYAIWKKDC